MNNTSISLQNEKRIKEQTISLMIELLNALEDRLIPSFKEKHSLDFQSTDSILIHPTL
jgi:hypothetical protein